MESPTITLADGTKVALVTVKSLKKGAYFKRIWKEGKLGQETFSRSEYNSGTRSYQCDKCSDIWGNGILLKGSVLVTTQFTY